MLIMAPGSIMRIFRWLTLVFVVFASTAPTGTQPPDLAAGVAAVNAGQTDEAIRLLERAVDADPGSRLALLHLANAHMAPWPYTSSAELATHGDAATAALQRALRRDDGDLLARWNLAMTYGRLGQIDASVAEMQRLMTIDAAYPDGARTLGTLLALQALEAMRRVKRELNVAAGSAWIADADVRAKVSAASGEAIERALEWLERARAEQPTSTEAVAMTNFALRLRAQIAPDAASAERDSTRADTFVQQAAALRRQSVPPAVAAALDPAQPPPPFSAPGAPPPPPPR